jgi:hypothetical protein
VSVVAAPLGEPVEGGPEMVASESGLLDDQVLRLGSICRGHAVSVSRSGFEDLPHPLAGPGGHDAPEGGCTLSGMGSGMPTMTDHAGSGRRVGDRSCNRAPRLNTGYAWPRLNIDRRAYRPAGRYGRAYSLARPTGESGVGAYMPQILRLIGYWNETDGPGWNPLWTGLQGGQRAPAAVAFPVPPRPGPVAISHEEARPVSTAAAPTTAPQRGR